MGVSNYQELIAWQKAMNLVEEIYRITQTFPREEIYGLTNQVRRAAVSIPSNIAEGQGRGIGGEFAHHLQIANGSRQEVETQLLIGHRLGYIASEPVEVILNLASEVGRVMSGLLRSVCEN